MEGQRRRFAAPGSRRRWRRLLAAPRQRCRTVVQPGGLQSLPACASRTLPAGARGQPRVPPLAAGGHRGAARRHRHLQASAGGVSPLCCLSLGVLRAPVWLPGWGMASSQRPECTAELTSQPEVVPPVGTPDSTLLAASIHQPTPVAATRSYCRPPPLILLLYPASVPLARTRRRPLRQPPLPRPRRLTPSPRRRRSWWKPRHPRVRHSSVGGTTCLALALGSRQTGHRPVQGGGGMAYSPAALLHA